MKARVITMGILAWLIGCGPHIRGDRMNPADITSPVVRYHAAKDLVVIDTTLTTRATKDIVPLASPANGFEVKIARVEHTSTGTLSFRAVADPSRCYALELTPGGTAEQKFDFVLQPSGVPKSIGIMGDDKSGEIVGNVVKFVAHTAAMVASGGIVGLAAVPREQIPGADTLADLQSRYRAADDEHKRLAAAVQQAQRDLESADDNTRQPLQARLDLLAQSLARVAAIRQTARADFELELAAFKARHGLGVTTQEHKAQFMFELHDVPQVPAGERAFELDSKTPAEVEQLLLSCGLERALQMWRTAHVAVTLQKLPVAAADPAAPFQATAREGELARVYYRRARPAELCVYVEDMRSREGSTDRTPVVRLVSRTRVDVLDPRDEPVSLAFEPREFSKQELTIGMDDNGRLVTLKQGSTPELAGFTGALAAGVPGGISAFADGLKAIDTVRDNQRALSTAEAEDETASVRAQAELAEARARLLKAEAELKKAME